MRACLEEQTYGRPPAQRSVSPAIVEDDPENRRLERRRARRNPGSVDHVSLTLLKRRKRGKRPSLFNGAHIFSEAYVATLEARDRLENGLEDGDQPTPRSIAYRCAVD